MRWFKVSFSTQILIAVLLGLLVGIFFGEDCHSLAPWASAYIMILKITAIPYLVLAVILGVGQLTGRQAMTILKKGFIFIAIAWVINLLIIYLAAWTFPPLEGNRHGSFSSKTTKLNIAQMLIPENIFTALANNIIPAIVIFSLLIGIALMQMREKKTVMDFFETLLSVFTLITHWISKITPFGTFALLAYESGTINLATVQQLGAYILLSILAMCFIVFWMVPRLISALTHFSAWKWIKDLFPILVLGFTTSLVIVTVPYIIAFVKKELLSLCPKDETLQTQVPGTVSIIFNLPLATLFIILFVLFTAHINQIPLGAKGEAQLVATTFLATLGSFGIGSWVNNVTFILDTLGLPLDAVDLYLATIPFTSGFQAMLSVTEIAALSLLVTFSSSKLISYKWKALPKIGIALLPILLIFLCLKIYFPFPSIKIAGQPLQELSIDISVPVKIYTKDAMPPPSHAIDAFTRIQESKILRVGYNTNVLPFCFWNNKGELAGYDVAFAYALARDLNCSLEFVPLQFNKIGEELASGLYDIGMSHITLTEYRLQKMLFSRSYYSGRIVLLVKESVRKEFADTLNIQYKSHLRIAAMKGSIFEEVAQFHFGKHPLILLDGYKQFATSDADAVLMSEAQAIAFSLLDPSLHVIFPDPPLGLNRVGYVLAPESSRFLHYLNEWLELKEAEGFQDRQYDIWIYGKTAPEEQKRWSILHNVFGTAKQ